MVYILVNEVQYSRVLNMRCNVMCRYVSSDSGYNENDKLKTL